MSTVKKALGLLEYFSSGTPEIGLSEFKDLTKFDKGTVYRYLTSLCECGFLEQNLSTKAYRLGPAVIRLAAVREITVPLVNLVAPFMEQLASDTHELVHAAIPQRNAMSTLYVVDGGHSGTRVGFDRAELLPFHATSSGIAMLAFGPQKLLKTTLAKGLKKFTNETSISTQAVDALIIKARAAGYAFANQSFEDEVCSVAVPFFGPSEFAIGTIAIATPASRMSDDMRERSVAQLTEVSTQLTVDLGGKVPANVSNIWSQL